MQLKNKLPPIPPIPGKKDWNPELELFLSSIRKDILNPRNIRNCVTICPKVSAPRSGNRGIRMPPFNRLQDKGSRLVLINSTEYNDKMFGQHNNPLHYKVLKSDPSSKDLGVVEQWCSKWLQRDGISPEIASWIVNKKAKPGVAFGNIKTHKKNNPYYFVLLDGY